VAKLSSFLLSHQKLKVRGGIRQRQLGLRTRRLSRPGRPVDAWKPVLAAVQILRALSLVWPLHNYDNPMDADGAGKG